MNAMSKALIAMVAIAAFIIGWLLNSPQVSSDFDSRSLLSAELIESSSTGETKGRVADKLGAITLVNFWATWCAPCREEMPMFEALFREHSSQGFQIVGVAIDSPSKAQPMLDSMDITYPILYAERTGMQLMDSVGNPNGLLPYTVLLSENGHVLEQKVGRMHAQDVRQWVEAHL